MVDNIRVNCVKCNLKVNLTIYIHILLQQVKIIPKCDNLNVVQPGNSTNKSITKDTDDIEYTNDLIYNIGDLSLNEEILESQNSYNEKGKLDKIK